MILRWGGVYDIDILLDELQDCRHRMSDAVDASVDVFFLFSHSSQASREGCSRLKAPCTMQVVV